MHYIPFQNEDPRNTEISINCICCPLIEYGDTSDNQFSVRCPYTTGYEWFSYDDNGDFFTLNAAKLGECIVQYRDTTFEVAYIRFMNLLINDSAFKEDTEDNLKRREDIREVIRMISKLYPDWNDMYYKINNGYKLDDHYNLYKEVKETKEVDVSDIGVKHEVIMFCKGNIYDLIDADKEITNVCGVDLDYPVKNVFDDENKAYYHFMKATPAIEEKMNNSDVVIINHSQFGEAFVDEKKVLASIAKIVNKPKTNNSNDSVES